ncbi:hypothetical protein BT67DRAFT_290531 [Trichocladium antarcticum]|uniref:Uncharacterized protein n=1 Tax=Trichocladium antarcticum TaxID=1450529 RepID=A0AAN6ZDH3_9PEZI|nr:hypothetical protein BT67DRAFT_290531 [Trichocladium antarcticum]
MDGGGGTMGRPASHWLGAATPATPGPAPGRGQGGVLSRLGPLRKRKKRKQNSTCDGKPATSTRSTQSHAPHAWHDTQPASLRSCCRKKSPARRRSRGGSERGRGGRCPCERSAFSARECRPVRRKDSDTAAGSILPRPIPTLRFPVAIQPPSAQLSDHQPFCFCCVSTQDAVSQDRRRNDE